MSLRMRLLSRPHQHQSRFFLSSRRPLSLWGACWMIAAALIAMRPILAADTPSIEALTSETSAPQPGAASQGGTSPVMPSAEATSPVPPLAKSPRIALVIGNKDYAQAPLKNPLHDAADIRNALLGVGFEVIYRENADVSAMTQAVREFRGRIQEGGVAMVYYSGHGAQADGINYLIPVGADIQSSGELKARAYDADIIVSEMTEAKSDVNILILDACRNNPFLSHRGSSGGLATMTASKGTIIAFATAPGAIADDNARGGNGLYTHFLKKHMTRKGLKIEDVFKKVREDVLKSNPRQIPWESSSLVGDFCLAGCGEGKPSLMQEPPAMNAFSAPAASSSNVQITPAGDPVQEKSSGFGLTSLDLQRGRCVTGGDGSYRCIERGRWQTLGRPNLQFAHEHQGEATEVLYCASLLTEEAQDNKCMTREEAVNSLKRCTPLATQGHYRCHAVEYWLKSILISNLSGSESTQSYTNEPIEKPEGFECRPQAEGGMYCVRQ
ncbi:MAG: hypothetical protein RLZ25_1655 [Pseudomonadota bacterium]